MVAPVDSVEDETQDVLCTQERGGLLHGFAGRMSSPHNHKTGIGMLPE
jgi:hypothetical protein